MEKRVVYRTTVPTGYCMNPNCGVIVGRHRVFCSIECEHEYQEIQHESKTSGDRYDRHQDRN